MTTKPILCALVIGHNAISHGATNRKHGMSEFAFNEALSMDIAQAVKKEINVIRIYRNSYRSLPDQINKLNPDFIISLHCNAFNKKVSGTEVMYHYRSIPGKKLAKILQRQLVKALGLRDRGIKPRSVESRGGYLLRYSNAPCVIAEPFFIDNNKDFKVARNNIDQLVYAYVNTIHTYADILHKQNNQRKSTQEKH